MVQYPWSNRLVQKIQNKNKYRFLQIDIKDYCSSINPNVLKSVLIFAKNTSKLTMKEIQVNLTARESVIKFDHKLYVSKDTPECINAAMDHWFNQFIYSTQI